MATVNWKIKGDNLSTCNCDWGCPCQFNARPTHGFCEAMVGIRITEGFFGDVDLGGVTFSAAAKWPGALHEGNGTIQLAIDAAASQAQREALLAMASGKNGGTFFEIMSAVCPNVLPPLIAPIYFASDRSKRTGEVRVEGLGAARVEPIRNPITGEEHHAQIHLPNGFEFKSAEVANAVSIDVTGSPAVNMNHSNCHAHLSTIEWGN